MKRRGKGVRGLFISAFLCCVFLTVPCAEAYYYDYYGNYVGITMKFNDVEETTGTENHALYNEPNCIGDSLQFNDLLFASYSKDVNSDITDGALEVTIESKPTYYIDRIRFDEFGDSTLSGSGTASTYASVNNSLLIKIREIDDVALSDPCTFSVDMVFDPQDSWNLADDGTIIGEDWSGVLNVDITAKLRELGFATGYATLLDITMDNTLSTASEEGTEALIMKKETNGLRITPMVPEPATILLLGLGGLTLLRRHRK